MRISEKFALATANRQSDEFQSPEAVDRLTARRRARWERTAMRIDWRIFKTRPDVEKLNARGGFCFVILFVVIAYLSSAAENEALVDKYVSVIILESIIKLILIKNGLVFI